MKRGSGGSLWALRRKHVNRADAVFRLISLPASQGDAQGAAGSQRLTPSGPFPTAFWPVDTRRQIWRITLTPPENSPEKLPEPVEKQGDKCYERNKINKR